jgi:hypothetical protein
MSSHTVSNININEYSQFIVDVQQSVAHAIGHAELGGRSVGSRLIDGRWFVEGLVYRPIAYMVFLVNE